MRLINIVAARKALSLFWVFAAVFASAVALVVAIAGAAQRRGVRNVNTGVNAVDLLIVGGVVVTMNSDRLIIENGFVAIRGERILDIGDLADLKTKGYKASQTIDARGKALLPGLI